MEQLVVNEGNKLDLMTSAKWGKFFVILGYIAVVLMVLAGVFTIVLSVTRSGLIGSGIAGMMSILGFLYVAIAAAYFFMVRIMHKMVTGFKKAVSNSSQNDLNDGFSNMAKGYKYAGYFTIVTLVLYLLFLVGFAASAAFFGEDMYGKDSEEIPVMTEMESPLDEDATEEAAAVAIDDTVEVK